MRATQRQRLRATQRQRLRGRRGNNDSFIWQAMMFLVLLPQAVSRAEPGKRRLSRRINKATAQGMCMAFACLALFLSVPGKVMAQVACTVPTITLTSLTRGTPDSPGELGGGRVQIDWSGGVKTSNCTHWEIQRAAETTTFVGASEQWLTCIEATELTGTFVDEGGNYSPPTPGSSYVYRMLAYPTHSNPCNSTANVTGASVVIDPYLIISAAAGEGKIDLSWTEVSGASYKLEEGVGGSWTEIALPAVGTTTYEDAVGMAGAEYQYRVTVNGADKSWSNETAAIAFPSPAPCTQGSFGITTLEDPVISPEGKINLRWSGDWGLGPGCVSWEVWRTVDDGTKAKITSITDENNRALRDDDVMNGKKYTYYIAQSEDVYKSNEKTVDPLTVITAVSDVAGKIDLSWNEISGASYKLERHVGTWSLLASPAVGTTTYTDTDVSADTEYKYRVRAVLSGTDKSWSNETYGIYPKASAPPNPASNFRVSLLTTGGSAQLNWDYSGDPAKPVTDWTLHQVLGGTETSATILPIVQNGGNNYRHLVTVTACTEYEFWVVAKGSAGNSVPSNKVKVTTYKADGTNTCTGTKPGDIAGLRLTIDAHPPAGVVSLNWDASSGAVDYLVEVEECEQLGTYKTLVNSFSGTSYTDNNPCLYLTGGTERYRVAGRNAVGYSAWKTESIRLEAPDPVGIPTELKGEPRGTNAPDDAIYDFTWKKPATGGIVTHYKFQRSTIKSEESAEWIQNEVLVAATAGTPQLKVDVPREVTYFYRVLATNSNPNGDSEPSNVVEVLVAATTGTPTTPAAPDTLTATKSANGESITVTWLAPADRGSAITGYEHQRRVNGTSETAKAVGATVLTFTDNVVEAGSRYQYRVRAKNANGDGSWSDYTGEIRGGLDTELSTQVKGLQATGGDKQISLRWTKLVVEGKTLRHYQVQVRNTATGTFANLATATSNTHVHTGLGDGVEHWYQVRADFTDDTSGSWSDIATAKTTGKNNYFN